MLHYTTGTRQQLKPSDFERMGRYRRQVFIPRLNWELDPLTVSIASSAPNSTASQLLRRLMTAAVVQCAPIVGLSIPLRSKNT